MDRKEGYSKAYYETEWEEEVMDIISQIKEEAKGFFKYAGGGHDWEHVERVYSLSTHIGNIEGGNLEIIKISSLLHDIGRAEQDKSKGKICHAIKGAELAKNILQKYDLPKEDIDNIIHCIETHRFRNKKRPETKEAKIVSDADKLDGIGAVGIGRAFMFSAKHNGRLHNPDVDITKTQEYTEEDTAYREFLVKLCKIKDRMITKTGKDIAQKRHDFMVKFFEQINKEIKGNL